jgi:uncharacterized membrane protein
MAGPRARARTGRNVERARLVELVDSGFVAVPVAAVTASIAAAYLTVWLDGRVAGPSFLFDGPQSVASSVLTTIAGSIMTMTSLLLSVAVVVLQLSSQQFSPRVLQMFFRDRGTKIALGIFLSTFVYALMVLRSLGSSSQPDAVPHISIAFAIVLALVSVAAFVFFVDQVVHSVQAVSIIETVAKETRIVIRAMQAEAKVPDDLELPDRPADLVLHSEIRPGVVTDYALDDLMDLAVRTRCTIRMVPSVGQFVPAGVPLAEVWSDDGSPPTVTAARIGAAIDVEQQRTMAQDAAFGFRQLVDIAEKALSPAVNDPTTASQCLNRIHDLLRRIGTGPLPTGRHPDVEGRVRVVVPAVTWPEFVGLGCNEIRLYGAHTFQVQRRMRVMLTDLLAAVPEDRKPPLRDQLDLLDSALVEHFADPRDRAWASDLGDQIDDA